MDFRLSEEQELILENMREFCTQYIDPIVVEIDETGRWPAEVFAQLGEMGWMGMPFPAEYGGAGLDYVTYLMVMEELSRSSASICLDLACHILCSLVINEFGNEEQKQKHLVPLAQGKRMGAFAITEPGAGTDVAALASTAVLDGDSYVLNGVKTFISNGPTADTFIILAYTDKSQGSNGMSTFIVTKESPGFRVGDHFIKMGLRSSQTSELIMKDCRIPKENLLGEEGDGLKIALASLDSGRMGIAAQAIGIAQAALEESINYSKSRVQFGKPICKNQAIQWMIADMETDIAAARLLAYRAAMLKDQGKPFGKESAIAKLFATEMANRNATKAFQIHGGYGYIKGVKVERLLRDVRITEIYEGTSEAMRMIIANAVLR